MLAMGKLDRPNDTILVPAVVNVMSDTGQSRTTNIAKPKKAGAGNDATTITTTPATATATRWKNDLQHFFFSFY
jgi:hypothetical protein